MCLHCQNTCWMFCTTKSISFVTFFPRVEMVTRTKYRSLTFRPLYDSYGFSAKLKSKRYCCQGGETETYRKSQIPADTETDKRHESCLDQPVHDMGWRYKIVLDARIRSVCVAICSSRNVCQNNNLPVVSRKVRLRCGGAHDLIGGVKSSRCLLGGVGATNCCSCPVHFNHPI